MANTETETAEKTLHPRARAWRTFRKNPTAMLGLVTLIILCVIAVLAPFIAPYDPSATNPRQMLQPPQPGHWLGTDDIGRDVLSRLIYAGRVSLSLGIGVALLAVTLGAVLGAIAGYFRGLVDTVVQALIDVLLSFPIIALAMMLGSFTELTPVKLVLLLAFLSWPASARIVRSQVFSLSEWSFVEAARAIGAATSRVLFKHIVPNTLAPLSVAATLLVAQAILAESALSFLGFGVSPPTPTWGNMLNGARIYFREAPWLALFPGIVISLTVASVNFVGDGLREALQPRGED